jgi:hypothetical protein
MATGYHDSRVGSGGLLTLLLSWVTPSEWRERSCDFDADFDVGRVVLKNITLRPGTISVRLRLTADRHGSSRARLSLNLLLILGQRPGPASGHRLVRERARPLARSCEFCGDGDRREQSVERRTPRLAPVDADGGFCFLRHEQVFSQPSEFRLSPVRGILFTVKTVSSTCRFDCTRVLTR